MEAFEKYLIESEEENEKKKAQMLRLWIVIGVVGVIVAIFIAIGYCIYDNHQEMIREKERIEADSINNIHKYENCIINIKGTEYKMIKVDGGTFTMGATPEMEETSGDATPTHQVTLSTYYIGQTEVTERLWEAVMGSEYYDYKDKFPIVDVSWNDCQEFISKLNTITRKKFRMPTEAEWEFAARGGKKSRGYKYSGSNNIDLVAWYKNNSNNSKHFVATQDANELGIYDMSGNVWEWCSDWYWYSGYSNNAQTNPTGPKSGNRRVIRGGCSYNDAIGCSTSYRSSESPDSCRNGVGFRLCISE